MSKHLTHHEWASRTLDRLLKKLQRLIDLDILL
jgi:hypothetical protein